MKKGEISSICVEKTLFLRVLEPFLATFLVHLALPAACCKLFSMPNPLFDEIVAALESFAQTAENAEALEKFAVETIAARLPGYNWVGFYMLDPADANMLILGPFVGAPTLHIRIPVTEGICGAAVAQGQTIVVDDVRSDPRYLACSIETQSEIVAPVRVRGQVVGEIDIDSHQRATFAAADRAFVERCADLLGSYLENHSK